MASGMCHCVKTTMVNRAEYYRDDTVVTGHTTLYSITNDEVGFVVWRSGRILHYEDGALQCMCMLCILSLNNIIINNKNTNFIDPQQKYIRISGLVLPLSEKQKQIKCIIVHVT